MTRYATISARCLIVSKLIRLMCDRLPLSKFSIMVLSGALLLTACGDEQESPEQEDPEPIGPLEEVCSGSCDQDACANFVVPSRIGFKWEKLNHRVSQLKYVHNPTGECSAESLDVTSVGGDFSTGETAEDIPYLRYSYQPVEQDGPGIAGAKRDSIEANNNPCRV